MNKSTAQDRRYGVAENDDELVARARRDPDAFGSLYERYVARIYRYLISHVGDVAEAEDLTAQVFTAAWEGLGGYEERGEFAAWLFRIARNKASDFHRQRRPHLSWEKFKEGLEVPVHVVWEPLSDLERAEDLERLASIVLVWSHINWSCYAYVSPPN